MLLFSKLFWKLASPKAKLARLRNEGLTIGEGCEILNGFDFGSEPYLVTIGNNVRIASGVKITTHDGGAWVLRNMYPELKRADRFGRVAIGDNVHVGMNALIMPGVTIGSNCIIGASAVVTHDVPQGAVVAGVPARFICSIEEYRDKHLSEFVMTKGLPAHDKRRLALKAVG